ncbi:ubiquitin fusion degradation protein [Exophiala xenobiotica]|nr:ubiquitin fusion degradation protein [Exophiala xenobiotica]KAK5222696.1 ubiquitin fusion degradation protein [Exophiala xenobiotica]KAK5233721.1 ubiquitin fusion degradation protein [Exophiala xenobiotica]KAK5247951.1 ubiquitin fusion degradation protein [Exophiala xenobiotica]KAK5259055.1 ubiquitin fusion degradation protein [Exophiala xenobiotica]
MMGFPSFMRGAPPVGMSMRRFDEYYRCYPVVMMSGPDRRNVNFGGKVFLPPSALDKLTRLHISYPMLFELRNGNAGKTTHAGVLEFVAEEGRIYLPQWLMKTLELDPGDLLQIKSIDLPPGKFIKLQPQSPAFLDISDPRAVLENAFRNFACLSKGDIFTFEYNDQTYDIAVLEIKPDTDAHAIVTMETDLEVDFATPVGYVPPERTSGTSTPRSGVGKPRGGPVHFQGTMAQSINYESIAPTSTSAAAGAKAVSSHFLSSGHKLSSKKSSKAPTPSSSTPVGGMSTNEPKQPASRRTNGPQPLRLPPGKLFFGYELKPLRKKDESGEPVTGDEVKPRFQGQGQTLRAKKRLAGTDSGTGSGVNSDAEAKPKDTGKGRR